jgi:outer membrane protein OmpA-like peptidoglycan-associated protein
MKKLEMIMIVVTLMATVTTSAQSLQSASPEQLEQQLVPNLPQTRSLRNLKPQPQSVDLVIHFDFDSAKLQDVSKPLLNNLAVAMQRERLKELKFKVEGHTDAKGSASYNQQLSERRAASVVGYLQEQGVEAVRLESVGKGASELLNPDKPLSMENRRVRVITQP